MTTIAIDRAPRTGLPLSRVVTVARVLLANWPAALGFPLGIMGTSFAINVLIFGAVGDAIGNAPTGGLGSLYVVQLIVCWQGLYQHFSFAVGLNATRRSYYLAAVLVALAQSLLFGLFLYACRFIEHATGGWGVNLRFFDPLPLTHSASPVTILVYTVPLVLVSTAGIFFGSVNRRWGPMGIFVLSVLTIVILGGLAALVTYLNDWPEVGSWFARSWLSLTIGWSLIPTVLAAVGGWLVLRRAVP
ncbi:MAG TPA: hypothetical protein VH561_21130 [Micromonosporaceae bacterium]|jgi:hypothetical protein